MLGFRKILKEISLGIIVELQNLVVSLSKKNMGEGPKNISVMPNIFRDWDFLVAYFIGRFGGFIIE